MTEPMRENERIANKIGAWVLEQYSVVSRNCLRQATGLPIEALNIGDRSLFIRIKEALDAKDSLIQAKEERIKELETNGFIQSCGDYFKIRKGMAKGRIWIESTGGEGGDFDQDELFMHIREFYDKRF